MAFNSLMHYRNIYKNRPDFAKIALEFPEFRKHALVDSKGKVRVDFNNPDALRMLTKILLKKDFNLSVEIPKGFLIPTIPQRLNYILWVEDLLTVLPSVNETPYGIDIGCGPCAIFSLLGSKKNGWKFVSTESSKESLHWALNNINTNNMNDFVKVVKVNSDGTLNELLSSNEDIYDFCLCNPPFFDNIDEIRKKNPKTKDTIATIAKQEEIFAEGGEVAFVKRIIDESFLFKDRIRLYTSMFGKKKSFVEIWNILQDVKDISLAKSQFCQGNTIRWGIAWTFLKSVSFDKLEKTSPKKVKKIKPKPPLIHPVPKDIEGVDYNVQALTKVILKILKDLEITVKVVRSHEHYIESLISSDKNTWSHQRRKRREMSRNVDVADSFLQSLPNCSSGDKNKSFKSKSFQEKALSSLCSPENKSDEDCVMLKVDCEAKLKNETKKRKLFEPQFDSQKKLCSDLNYVKSDDVSSLLKPNEEFGTNLSGYKTEDCLESSENLERHSTTQLNKIQADFINEYNKKMDINVTESNDCKEETVTKKSFQQDTKKKEILNDKSSQIDTNNEAKSLLSCTLKIRKAKEFVLIEMNCPLENNRETMHQIFQYLKNKLQGSL